MTRAEMDRIWVIDGLKYRIRDEYVSADTQRLSDQYLAARKRQDREGIRRTGKALEASRDRDIAAALDRIRGGG